MRSPEFELNLSQNPDLLTPINGQFAGKNLLSIAQLDKKSCDVLFSTVPKIAEIENRALRPPMNGLMCTTMGESTVSLNRLSFESAFLRMGGQHIVYPPSLPRVEDAFFDYAVLNFKAHNFDLLLFTHYQKEALVKTMTALNSVEGKNPIIVNIDAFDFNNQPKDADSRFGDYPPGKDLDLKKTLLALIMGKVS